ncbi:MAG TPA: hypothetical protein VHP83_16295 [Aggregatilineaceae bacterium]|nr:hypothetical protein [Aggregatilineaceae bacterium]
MAEPNKLEKIAAERGVTVKQLIEEALRKNEYIQSKAAFSLGVYPYAVKRYMKKFNIKVLKDYVLSTDDESAVVS